MKPWAYVILAITAIAGLSMAVSAIYSAGRDSVLTKLQNDRVRVLQDGREVDKEVFGADDDSLYCMLVECMQSDGSPRH